MSNITNDILEYFDFIEAWDLIRYQKEARGELYTLSPGLFVKKVEKLVNEAQARNEGDITCMSEDGIFVSYTRFEDGRENIEVMFAPVWLEMTYDKEGRVVREEGNQ